MHAADELENPCIFMNMIPAFAFMVGYLLQQ